jgi:hypothetical protein
MNLQDFEKYIKSLKDHGFSDDMVTDFLQHMGVTSEVPILLNVNSKLTKGQRWAIACGADNAFYNGEFINDITTGFSKNEWVQLLSDFWEIGNKENAFKTINWLFKEGDRLQFPIYWEAINIVTINEKKEYLWKHIVKDTTEEAVAFHLIRNLEQALYVFKQLNLFDSDTIPNMLIWDYARIINISRGCYDAGYFSQDEALGFIMRAAGSIRQSYKSWKQLSISYQFARYFWRGIDEEVFKKLLGGMHLLLTHSNSPWVTLKWEDS